MARKIKQLKRAIIFIFLTVGIYFSCPVSFSQNQNTIQLQVGEQKTLKMEFLQRVAIADENIADVRIIAGGEQLLIIGLSEGATDITLWDKKGSEQLLKVVVGKNVNDLANEIKTLLSDVEGITVRVVGNKVVLDGTVLVEDDKARIEKITQAYPDVLNLVIVDVGTQSQLLESTITQALNMPQVKVKVIGNKAVLEGGVASEADIDKAAKIAAMYLPQVVNLLEVAKEMIEIDLCFAQIDYSKGKSVGSNVMKELSLSSSLAGGKGLPTTTNYGLALNAVSKLNVLFSGGAGTIISRPHLSTVSGKKASFHSGGEIGYEVSGTGAANVEWKKYGLLMDIEPVMTSSGDIKTHISIEVSAPVTSGNTATKAFTMFKTESDLVCKQGESVVISGLVQSIRNKFQEKTPLLGDVPILDLFFKKKTDDDVNKEMVVVVTPTVTTLVKSEAAPASRAYENVLKKAEE